MGETVQQHYDANPDLYASAKLSAFEIGLYKRLIRRIGGEVEKLREYIETPNEGIPFHIENPRDTFLKAGLLHGCSVAGILDEEIKACLNGRTYEDTIWSYLTKNRAYRFIEMALIKSGQHEVLSEWQGSIEKKPTEQGELESILTRPTSLHKREDGNPLIVGIEKPACYFPSQLLRVLEGLRLGKEHIVEIGNGDQEKRMDILSDTAINAKKEIPGTDEMRVADSINCTDFTFYWENLGDSICEAQTIEDIAVNTALCVARYLKGTELFDDQTIALIIAKGYSPKGPIKENGLVDDVTGIWDRIFANMELEKDLCGISKELKVTYDIAIEDLKISK